MLKIAQEALQYGFPGLIVIVAGLLVRMMHDVLGKPLPSPKTIRLIYVNMALLMALVLFSLIYEAFINPQNKAIGPGNELIAKPELDGLKNDRVNLNSLLAECNEASCTIEAKRRIKRWQAKAFILDAMPPEDRRKLRIRIDLIYDQINRSSIDTTEYAVSFLQGLARK